MTSADPRDLGDLLETAEPVSLLRRPLILWLVVIGLVALFLPLYLVGATISNDTARLETELEEIQLALAVESTIAPEAQTLQESITQVQGQVNEFKAIQESLSAGHVDWRAAVAAIADYDVAQTTLTSLVQTDNRLTLIGQAAGDATVIEYARRLEESGQFARVVVQSITLLPTPAFTPTPTPTADATMTPAATATATGGSQGTSQPTITSTPELRDEFEVDDVTPKPIFLGLAQQHNFYPTSDVDNGYFLAKAGRFYQVLTTNLSPGVDTFLTITVGGTVLTNDDGKPGTLGSQIDFQVPAGADVQVLVRVTNRGQYGPEMAYQLLAQEIVPTPIPTLTTGPTATPGPTFTPAPTVTPLPTHPNTPTATPDLRDIYEPNDTNPSAIAVGETQMHNFYPQGDVDKVTFIVKEDRFYRIATAGLALGVDTFMVVELGGEQWQNDDYAPPGSGNFASAICFPAAMDGAAVATLTNKAQQYSPDKTYDIGVAEVSEIVFSTNQLNFGSVVAGGPNPPSQTVQLSSTSSTEWSAETEQPWINFTPTAGNTPATVSAGVDISGLPVGSYEGQVTFAWASLCRQTITVTLQIVAPLSYLDWPSSLARSQSRPGDGPARLARQRTASLSSPRLTSLRRRPLLQNLTVEFVILLELKVEGP